MYLFSLGTDKPKFSLLVTTGGDKPLEAAFRTP
jgi:hypothetical protein